ncbi:MAG: DUF6428 family protein [Pseudomonadota bacterium]
MTLQTLLDSLKSLPAHLPISFATTAGPAGWGYHVTELKHAQITSIDCGGRVAEWAEATLQILDGDGARDRAMQVGKLAGILSHSIGAVAGLGDADLQVEFSHGNAGMQIFEPGTPRQAGDLVTIDLSASQAQCKPASAFEPKPKCC